jgi:hypothetical protein
MGSLYLIRVTGANAFQEAAADAVHKLRPRCRVQRVLAAFMRCSGAITSQGF